MGHARAWEVLRPEEREQLKLALDEGDVERVGVGYATWRRAVKGDLIPKVAAALCRHWLQKRTDRANAHLRRFG